MHRIETAAEIHSTPYIFRLRYPGHDSILEDVYSHVLWPGKEHRVDGMRNGLWKGELSNVWSSSYNLVDDFTNNKLQLNYNGTKCYKRHKEHLQMATKSLPGHVAWHPGSFWLVCEGSADWIPGEPKLRSASISWEINEKCYGSLCTSVLSLTLDVEIIVLIQKGYVP